MAAPHIHDLALIIEDLEAMGRLARVTSEVDPAYDLAGLAHRMEGGPRAVLFEKVKGHPWPVFTGLYWNRELLADLLRQEAAGLSQYVSGRIEAWQRQPVDPVVVDDAPVLEVTEPEVDLRSIPVPIHAERDGGPYFDAPVVIAKDPETGVRNASIQRFQVIDATTLHVNIDAGRHLELYLDKAKALGRSLTFTLSCGVGPGLHFAASAPAEAAPPETDELGIASAFHGRPVELARASNGHDEMVAHAMWALECEMIPGEVAEEGPFAEVTGYYAGVAPRPVVHVRKIHRRAKPVFQTILSGMEVWNSVGLLGEANVLALLQRQVPGVRDVYFSHGGSGFYHAVVQIAQTRAGWSKQAIMAAFAAFPPLKMVTVVDEDVDIRSATDVEWAMATRMNPRTGITVLDDAFGHGLNPSFPDYLGPKVGFDATRPHPPTEAFERVTYKPMALEAARIVEREVSRPRVDDHGRGDRAARAAAVAAEAELARPAPIRPEDLRGPVAAPGPPQEEETAMNDADAWLARPQPIDLAALTGRASRETAEDDDRGQDRDAWLARPQPIDLDALAGRTPRDAGEDDDAEDPDAWLARPQPIDVAALAGRSADRAGAEADEDPDAWLARPQPIDPAALGGPVTGRTPGDDDPDAWIARPQPARFDIPEPAPIVDPELLAAKRAAAPKRPKGKAKPKKAKADRDTELARPQPARFEVPAARPAPSQAAKTSGGKARAKTKAKPASRAAAAARSGPAKEPAAAPSGPAAAPAPRLQPSASGFFESTTASAPKPRATAVKTGANGRFRPRPQGARPAAPSAARGSARGGSSTAGDEGGGFFEG